MGNSDQQLAEAVYLEACEPYDLKRYAEALPLMKRAAELGHPLAQTALAFMYQYGNGVEKDQKQAMFWFSEVAGQGNAVGQWLLGSTYERGEGFPADYEKAMFWYRKAAEQGNARGQWYIGHMYEDGKGVAQDYDEAMRWYLKSAEQGDPYAYFSMGKMYEDGVGVPQDFAKAREWYIKIYNAGNRSVIDELERLAFKERKAAGNTQPDSFPQNKALDHFYKELLKRIETHGGKDA